MVKKLSDLTYMPQMPENPKFKKIMIVGAGEIIEDCHLPAYNLAGFEVHGIYNRTVEKAEKLAERFGIPNVYGDLDEFIAQGVAIDAIFDIALPASKFCEVLRKLPNNTAVLLQKPMGESIEEAKQILEICREKKLIAGVNFQLRQTPYIIAAKKFIDSGKLGDIVDLEFRETVYTPWHLWEFLEHVERMEINYHSIHFLDTIRYLLGEPNKVYCKTIKHPKAMNLAQVKSNIILDYGDMLRASVHSNHNHEYGLEEQESFLKIEGTKGAMKITIGVYLDYPKGLPDKTKYILIEDQLGWRELEVPGSWFPEAFIGTMGGLMHKLEDASFNYVNSVEDAYKTMCLVESCYISNEIGGEKIVCE